MIILALLDRTLHQFKAFQNDTKFSTSVFGFFISIVKGLVWQPLLALRRQYRTTNSTAGKSSDIFPSTNCNILD